ncbi:P27 family phage terminase small subunit [Brucella sp. 6810]|uniref:P27 family phage terminase small subunit n=1 Tax=Brucella sp. 6810 TaxID=2769351 RepID=UPI00165C7E66|nr:P27 family phage terminase small subunit [Brucella sp. 6810]QNQ63103.1 P27 family phage terminase small subunit [Brucella sp. 6810]
MTHLRGIKPPLKADANALTKAPPPPKRLTKWGAAEWKRVMPQLITRRIITSGDLAGIENYCAAVGAAQQIAEHMRTLPLPDLKLGGLQIRYTQTARQLAAEYGLTPTSRARVGGNVPDDDDADDDNPLKV